MDRHSTIAAANAAVTRLLGGSPERLIGAKITELTPPDVASDLLQLLDQAVVRGEPVQFEDRREGRDWAVSIYPWMIPGQLTIEQAAAPDNVMWRVLVVMLVGTPILAPSLFYLYRVFKQSTLKSRNGG